MYERILLKNRRFDKIFSNCWKNEVFCSINEMNFEMKFDVIASNATVTNTVAFDAFATLFSILFAISFVFSIDFFFQCA